MATQAYTNTPKVRLISSTSSTTLDTLVCDGLDAESNAALQAFFDASGAFTGVTITQEDANRDGDGVTGGFYNVLKMVFVA